MSEIIASTYQIEREIGSGGGGIVYLARHLRLGKWVVLKEDRRKLSAKPESLRREVDILKNLSQTYIPQVYDFLVEGDCVYTVMDYIEGRSLDKLIQEERKFRQPQVIEWACELLEALVYLHSRPPYGILHSDIKPSNIMVTPEGEIRLIDFNIALALGENGAVRVGRSKGYASPEHYGTDFSDPDGTRGLDDSSSKTEEAPTETVIPEHRWVSTTTENKVVHLDVRSDIYCLGATLYHLVTGHRPAEKAVDVIPVSDRDASPAVAAIINKAMRPNPDERFQKAEEMLRAFEHLHDNDPRTKRRKRRIAVSVVCCLLMFLLGGSLSFIGLKQMERMENAHGLAADSEKALREGDTDLAISLALKALPKERTLLDPPYSAEAQRALVNALGIYDLREGYKTCGLLKLPGNPVKVDLSPNGTYAAALSGEDITVYKTDSRQQIASLPAEYSALSDFVFHGENTLYYAGIHGLTAWDLANRRELWHTDVHATAVALSEDGTVVATVYKDEDEAFVFDAHTGEQLAVVNFQGRKMRVLPANVFADRKDGLFVLDETGERLAVSFSDGSLFIFPTDGTEGEIREIYSKSDYVHFEGGFHHRFFAVSAASETKTLFALYDFQLKSDPYITSEAERMYHIQADQSGIFFSDGNIVIQINPDADENGDVQSREVAYVNTEISDFIRRGERVLVLGADGNYTLFDDNAYPYAYISSEESISFLAFGGDFILTANRDNPELSLQKWEYIPTDFHYDYEYDHSEARLHSDGKTATIFGYGHFCVVDGQGSVLADVTVPDRDNERDPQYRRPGDTDFLGCLVTKDILEIQYHDGMVLQYDVKNGKLLVEEQGAEPDPTLYEQFETADYVITSPLHGTPEVYNKEGTLVGTLTSDAELAYVTQVGNFLIAEFDTEDAEQFGQLLDGQCNVLADYPDISDVLNDGTLLFDDMEGGLRIRKVLSLSEVRTIAENKKGV